jgi:hypothetical protein
MAALRLGASEGGIISLSPAGPIGGEHCVDDAQLTQLNAALEADANHHVTVVAATGDIGAAGEPCALIDALGGSKVREYGIVALAGLSLAAGPQACACGPDTGALLVVPGDARRTVAGARRAR